MNMTATATKRYRDYDDETLLARVIGGDIEAYEGIIRHHNQRLFRIARSIVADDGEAMDVVQETFIRAFERIDTLRDSDRLPVWLSRIARNGALMRLRKSERVEYMEDADMDNLLSFSAADRRGDQPDSRLSNAELGKLLESCIDELPLAFRVVFMLRGVQQCSVEETAVILDIKQATVKTRYHRARRLLQERLLDHAAVTGIAVHEFAGHRCDTITRSVMAHVRAGTKAN